MVKTHIILALIFFSSLYRVNAQGVGIGASVIYNFQTESFGSDIRVNLKPHKGFRIVPQLAYYPSFNKIHEYYAGLGLELNIFKIKRYSFYLLAHGAYNNWINVERSVMKDVEASNWALEGGIGLVKNTGCWRPFVECRYNVRWQESNLRIGIMYVIACNDKYASLNRQRRRAVSCPAYN